MATANFYGTTLHYDITKKYTYAVRQGDKIKVKKFNPQKFLSSAGKIEKYDMIEKVSDLETLAKESLGMPISNDQTLEAFNTYQFALYLRSALK